MKSVQPLRISYDWQCDCLRARKHSSEHRMAVGVLSFMVLIKAETLLRFPVLEEKNPDEAVCAIA